MVILTDNDTCALHACDNDPDGINPDGTLAATCKQHTDDWWARLNAHMAKGLPEIPEVPEEEQCVTDGCESRREWPQRYCSGCH